MAKDKKGGFDNVVVRNVTTSVKNDLIKIAGEKEITLSRYLRSVFRTEIANNAHLLKK